MQESQRQDGDQAAVPVKGKQARSWLLPGVIGFVALAVLVFFMGREDIEVPVAQPPAIPEPATTIESKPELVQAQQAVREPDQAVIEVAPVPSTSVLTGSNPALIEDLHALSDSSQWHAWTDTEDLIRKSSVVLDNLALGSVVLKPLPIPKPKQSFKVLRRDNKTYLDPASYARYEAYVAVIRELDADQLAVLYRQYLPLLEQSYAELEGADEDVDKRVAASLDFLLSTPVVEDPIVLRLKGAIYQFSDPALEALPAVQKQLIRMGPENTKVLLDKAAQLKQALAK